MFKYHKKQKYVEYMLQKVYEKYTEQKNHNNNKPEKTIPGYDPMELLIRNIINIPSRIEKRNICDISDIFRPLNMEHILVRIEIGNTYVPYFDTQYESEYVFYSDPYRDGFFPE
jgi:hypothetical protein